MIKSIPFLLLVFLAGCMSSHIPDKDELVCIKINDQNGLSETFNDKSRIQQFESVDFLESQPYKKVLRIFGKDTEGKSHSIITSYHSNGMIKQYLEGVDTIAYGNYKEWHSNGKLKIESQVIGGPCDLSTTAQSEWLFNGKSKAWNEEGQLEAVISYEMGALEGESKYYYSSGNLKKIIPFVRNKIHGEVCEYYESGFLKSKIYFEKGLKHGPGLGYWANETPSYFEEYDKDALITGIYYSTSGSVISEIQGGSGLKAIFKDKYLHQLLEYRKGKQNGKVQFFTRKGEIKKQFNTIDGKKQGEEIEFYLSNETSINHKLPQTKLLIYWDNNTIHGRVKTWYENGNLESQKEYYRNKKNGISCGWYLDGNLMFLEEYENDLLVKGTYYKPNQTSPTSKINDGNGLASIYDGKTGAFLRKIRYQNGKPQE